MVRHAQLHLKMPGLTKGEFGWSRGNMATLQLIQNERLIQFKVSPRLSGKIFHFPRRCLPFSATITGDIAVILKF